MNGPKTRLWLNALAVAVLAIAPGAAHAQRPDTVVKPKPRPGSIADTIPACCRIVRLDTASTTVTARETATGFTFQFNVRDPRLRTSLVVGERVWADFATQTVRLKKADGEPCCNITRTIRPRGSAPPRPR